MKILVTGSSGFIGSALIDFFNGKNHEVYRLVRGNDNLLRREVGWDLTRGVVHPSLLEGMDVVVHLAGESVLGYWTQAKKEKIRRSRVEGTKLLCKALYQLNKPPGVFVSASAIGYYGSRGDELLTECSTKGCGFLADVCAEWEDATLMAVKKGIRTINLRIGMVLSPKGGALKKMLPIFKWGLGGRLGSGNQYISWIAIDDLVRVIDTVIREEKIAGPVNAVAPYPVTNTEFTKVLGSILRRPTFFALPEVVVRLLFGEAGKELLLASQRAIPAKLQEKGFQFISKHIENFEFF